jgi:hypothetical protein
MRSLCQAHHELRVSHRPGRTAGRVALAVGLAAASLALAAAPAQAAPAPSAQAPHITFGVQPGLRNTFDSTRADFSYSATPGARMTDYVAIRNYANAAVTLQTYAGDAFNGPTGAYDILRRGRKSKDLGAWITLARTSVKVPGRSFVIIPFRIQLPAGALPGDHDAGIVASIITQQLRSNGSRVSVEERVGNRVHIRVSGPLRPQLSVRQLKTVFHGALNPVGSGSATVSYAVVNTGNVRLSAAQQVQLHAMIGGTRKVRLARLPELLPGNSFKQQADVSGVWPGLRVKATVALDPAASPQAPVPGLVTIRKSASTWALPWTLIGLIALLAGLMALVTWLRRRRAAAAPAAKPEAERVLVGAGIGGPGSDELPVQPTGDPIDRRDPAPVEVDVREPGDHDVMDLFEQPAPKSDPDSGVPPSSDPNRK